MNNKKYFKILLRVSAIFLWYFTPLFFLVISSNSLLKQNTFLGDLIIRFPYQWDYELMFLGFYLVWGVFVWKVAENPENNMNFIKFTAWGFFVTALTNIVVGFFRMQDLWHLSMDSIPWLALSFLIFYFIKNSNIPLADCGR